VTLTAAPGLKDGERENDPAAYHGTARFALEDEVEELNCPPRETLPPGGLIILREQCA
jgi:hypothetical protein